MIRISRILLVVILLIGFASCVELFRPDLGSSDVVKIVVDGEVTDQEGFQIVSVSTTSPLNKPDFAPLSFCKVKIVDDLGNEFILTEYVKGRYRVWVGKEYLSPGRSYQVKVITASGIEIVSDFDKMPEPAEIDSVHYKRKDFPTSNPNLTIQAVQFYIDITRKNTSSNYYRWDIDETWEHHAVYPITWYSITYDSPLQHYFPPNYSRFICWTTERIKNIYTFSTENTKQTKYIGIPIQIVDNQTQKLTFGYSALIFQHALSESAYEYCERLRINSNEQGGLYSTQPLRIKGNLKSTTNPELEILGFFSASSVKTKRIFVRNVENFDVYEPSCAPPDLPGTRYRYFIMDESMILHGYFEACFECDYLSGSTEKPSFWPY